jgi:hemoglobin
MRKKKYLTGILVVFMAVAAGGATAMATEKPDESLYKRLGGYDAIAAVVDDFFGRLAGDPLFARFFMGHSTQTKARIRQLTVDQLCAITGGPCVYIGRDMKTAHAGLGINEAEWETSVKHLAATLDKFKVPQKEKDELIALAATLKGDIVEKPAVKK